MELKELLKQQGIRKVIVIDDIYDAAPRSDELSAENWSIFFDDLGEGGHEQLTEIYPAYESTDREDLQNREDFISILWEKRSMLVDICRPLFSEYENTNKIERKLLDELVVELQKLELVCSTMGREITEDAKQADLVFIDLFLGYTQSEDDMAEAIKRVKMLIKGRSERPPLVVLMSRSPHLKDKRNEFRDQACLLGSMFRVVSKLDLSKGGMVAMLLTRLASHYEDAKRVASFVHAWDQGLNEARKRFIQILRRLDLADLAQVQTLLLDFEGQKPGEYLLDISDRVLQHEIESETLTIAAAKELNNIDLSKYPAPHLSGSPDLQDLVYRMIFQHRERLKLSENETNVQVQLGDVYQLVNQGEESRGEQVRLVITPACDLARCSSGANVLVLPGDLKPFTPSDWSYKSGEVRTSIFTANDGTRSSIRWDLKNRHTWTITEILQKIRNGDITRVGRIRELYAIEIQQKLLADMGRIGQLANLPATFSVAISIFYVSNGNGGNSIANQLDILGLETAVCFVGRDAASKRIDHLVLSESACDALRDTMMGLPDENVHQSARPSLAAMKYDTEFFTRFEKGLIEIPSNDSGFKEVKNLTGLIYLNITRSNQIKVGEPIPSSNLRKAPFIIKISDIAETEF